MAENKFNTVSLQLSDPTVGVTRAGALFDKAFEKLGNIGTRNDEEHKANVDAQTEANTASIIAELQANKNLDTVDQTSADIISGLANRFDGNINTGGFDLTAINQAKNDHRGNLLDERNKQQTFDINASGEKRAQELQPGAVEAQKLTNELTTLNKKKAQFDVNNQQKTLDQSLATSQAQQDTAKRQGELASINTEIAQKGLDKLGSDEKYTAALNDVFLNFPILNGSKITTVKEFDQAMSKFRSEAIAAGTPPDVFNSYATNLGLINNSTGKSSQAGLTKAVEIQAKNLRAGIAKDDVTMKRLKGFDKDYTSAVVGELAVMFPDPTDTEPLNPGQVAGSNVMPLLQRTLSEMNGKLDPGSRKKYTMQDVYTAIQSGDIGFKEGGWFTDNRISIDKVEKAIKKTGSKRHIAIDRLQAVLDTKNSSLANMSSNLIDYAYNAAGQGNQ